MVKRLASGRHRLRSRASAFIVALAVIAVLVGCVEGPALEYRLTVSASDGGSVTGPGEGAFTYDAGTVVDLVAVAEQGYEFVNWTGDVGNVADIDAPETTITMRADYSITANFEPLPIVQFDLTVSSMEGGAVTAPGEGVFTYDADTVVDLVAVADDCYEFVNWTGDGVADPYSASTTISITIGENATAAVTANFARLRYQLTVNSTDFGSVNGPGEGTFTYDCGAMVGLAADPAVRCRFAGWAGDVESIDDVDALEITVLIGRDLSVTAHFEVTPMVTAGIWHTVGLKSDGTVIAVGSNTWGQSEVGGWTDIVQVAAGERHTVGLKANGTVVAVGSSEDGQCDVDGWSEIVQIDAGRHYTVGLKSDGTVLAVGGDLSGQLGVGGWTDIVQVATGFYHTLGLKSDGTVVAVGNTGQGRLQVQGWTDIIQVGAGGHHSLGLTSDGTVLAVGRDNYGETNVGGWTDIVQVVGGCQASVGLKSDGTVVHSGWCDSGQCLVGGWSDITQVDAGIVHAVGLKADGTVVAAGSNSSGQCNVGDWILG